jgi:hypothetical protein
MAGRKRRPFDKKAGPGRRLLFRHSAKLIHRGFRCFDNIWGRYSIPELVGKESIHRNKTRSSRRAWGVTACRSRCIRRNIGRRPLALSQVSPRCIWDK